ncbi:MAG: hypothetical protein P8X70_03225 [Nanoarchaeota archaeon]
MPTKFEKLDKNKRFDDLLEEYRNYSPDNDKTGKYGMLVADRILQYFEDTQEFTLYYKIIKFREKHS